MIKNLNPRERLVVGLGLLVVMVSLIWLLLLNPYFAELSRLDRRIAAQQRSLAKVQQMQQQIVQLRQQLATGGTRRKKGKPLFSQVENLTEQTGLREQLLAMRPQPATLQGGFRQQLVEIRLEKLKLGQLVKFLHAVEYRSGGVQVKSLRIRPRFEDRSELDINMLLMSLEKV